MTIGLSRAGTSALEVVVSRRDLGVSYPGGGHASTGGFRGSDQNLYGRRVSVPRSLAWCGLKDNLNG
ncbi:MAG: hypothetical protein Q4A71_08360, partial [Actinomycetaceae bacterium]|nr:hypothetical protein [Actinomycetaceae bacterium]